MSRSYKKYPIHKKSNKYEKRHANKVVRKYSKDISNGKYYRKLFQSYNICDYIFWMAWEDYKENYLNRIHKKSFLEFYSEKDLYRFWRRYYHNK